MRITAALAIAAFAIAAGLLLGMSAVAAEGALPARLQPETLARYLDQLDCAGRATPEETADCRAVAERILAAMQRARAEPPRLDNYDFWLDLLGCREGSSSIDARLPCYIRAGRLLDAAVRAMAEPGT